jgi:hypothetical protein
MVIFPVFVLLLVQINALRYQSESITRFRRIVEHLGWPARRIACGREPYLPRACQTATPAGSEIATVVKTHPRTECPLASPISPMGRQQCNPRLLVPGGVFRERRG